MQRSVESRLLSAFLAILGFAAWFQILLWFAMEDDKAATIWGIGLAIIAVSFVIYVRWLMARN